MQDAGCNFFSCIVVAIVNKCSCCQSRPPPPISSCKYLHIFNLVEHQCCTCLWCRKQTPNSSGSIFLQHFSWSVFISTCGPKEHFHLCLWGESDQWHSVSLGVHHYVMSSLCHLDTLVSATNALLCNIFIVWVLPSATNALHLYLVDTDYSHICNKTPLCNIFIRWAFSHLQQTVSYLYHVGILTSATNTLLCNMFIMWAFSHLQQTLLCNMFIYVGIFTSATNAAM